MKKIIVALMLSVATLFAFTGCGNTVAENLSNDMVSIDGVYVDNSYEDKDSDVLKLLYVYYTVTPSDSNVSFSSRISMNVGDNSYNSDIFAKAADYSSSYYYSSTIKDLYKGEDGFKVLSIFKVPVTEFNGEEPVFITLDDSDIDFSGITISSESIVYEEGSQAIAKAADPEGYKAECERREAASSADEAYVKDHINGYYWDFYVNNTSYKIEFYAPNNFELTTIAGTVTGKYTVLNGYVSVKNDSNGYVTDIPWSKGDDDIKLDVADGYDVSQ